MALGAAFLGLDLLPEMMAALICAAEQMRMPTLHLFGNGRGDVGEVEGAGFLGHARVEDDLEQQIAKLVLQLGQVAAADRVVHLIGFLDRIRRDRREGLHAVPFAACRRIAQPRHDRQQTIDGGALFLSHR